MAYLVGRVGIVERLEDLFGKDPREYLAAYDAALQKLESRDLLELATDRVDTGDVDHFRRDWLEGGWWDTELPVAETLRDGLVEALRTAREAEMPLGTIWVTGASDGFETHVVKGAHQVTLVLLTPPQPEEAAEAY